MDESTLQIFLKAQAGEAVFQFLLGTFYQYGNGVQRDYEKAFYWYLKAANQGSSEAQNNLASLYQEGLGVEKDLKKAHEWLLKSAQQNHGTAQFNLGLMHYYGLGIPINYEEAFAWFLKAAKNNEVKPKHLLGVMYYYGKGVKKNDSKAVYWWKKAADSGNVFAQHNLGCMYQIGAGVRQDYQEALKWYQLAANKGNSSAQHSVGLFYKNGWGVEKDVKKAFLWIKLSAQQGNRKAQNTLGEMYQEGLGTTINYKESSKWIHRAADQGFTKKAEVFEEKESPLEEKAKEEVQSLLTAIAQKSKQTVDYVGVAMTVVKGSLKEHADCDGVINITDQKFTIAKEIASLLSDPTKERILIYNTLFDPLEEGKAIEVPGFKAPFDFLIHTVIPNYQNQDSLDVLQKAFQRVFFIADEKGIKRLAVIVSDIQKYGYSGNSMMNHLVRAVLLERGDFSQLEEIRFITQDEAIYRQAQEVINEEIKK